MALPWPVVSSPLLLTAQSPPLVRLLGEGVRRGWGSGGEAG